MVNAVLVSIFGYAIPRIVWLLLGKRMKTGSLKSIAQVITVFYAACVIYILILPNIMHAIAFVFLITIAVMDELLGWMRFLHKRIQRTHKDVKHASKVDKTWDDSTILQRSRELVNHYKVDWEAKDLVAIEKYSTDRFSYHNRLFLEALNNLNRSISLDANIIDLDILDANDVHDNEQDTYSLYVTTDQKMEMFDNDTKKVIIKNDGIIEEIFRVEREDNDWRLNASAIAFKGEPVENTMFSQYAHQEGFYYNNRTSYLLLPHDDRLCFSGFTDSGHMILGVRSNLLVNIFLMKCQPDSHYVVATTTLPDNYPHILIRNRDTSDFQTDALHRVSVEWPEFNENYDLFVDKPNSEKILLSLLSTDLVKYLLSLTGSVSVEIMNRTVYVIFASNEKLLKLSPEILAVLHRRALTSESTKALMH